LTIARVASEVELPQRTKGTGKKREIIRSGLVPQIFGEIFRTAGVDSADGLLKSASS
jgi:hypothetical protein